jgi:protein-S-isoprenylcysteine O-methyltransferase Ste14
MIVKFKYQFFYLSSTKIRLFPGVQIIAWHLAESWAGLQSIFLLVPGFLLGIVPVFIIQKVPGLGLPAGSWNWASLQFWIVGIAVIIWCAADFVRKGHGTPAPLDPPRELVVTGLYHYVRNPMYVGALLIQVGNIVWFGRLPQVVYRFFLFTGFNLFIRANEEPYLHKTFGAAYAQYCKSVPRWFPQIGKRG